MGNTVILHIGFGHNGGMISDALNDSHIDETVLVSLPPDFKNLKDNPALTELEDSVLGTMTSYVSKEQGIIL